MGMYLGTYSVDEAAELPGLGSWGTGAGAGERCRIQIRCGDVSGSIMYLCTYLHTEVGMEHEPFACKLRICTMYYRYMIAYILTYMHADR